MFLFTLPEASTCGVSQSSPGSFSSLPAHTISLEPPPLQACNTSSVQDDSCEKPAISKQKQQTKHPPSVFSTHVLLIPDEWVLHSSSRFVTAAGCPAGNSIQALPAAGEASLPTG